MLFRSGSYEDTVDCDVVPMSVCHLLLGRPWQFDKAITHDGRTNYYSFKWNNKVLVLRPMTPSQIITDNAKTLVRAQEKQSSSKLIGETTPTNFGYIFIISLDLYFRLLIYSFFIVGFLFAGVVHA